MSKTKKRIAIVCVVLNIILLSQLCFGSVSAFYDAVTSLAAESGIGQVEAKEIVEDEDEHICENGCASEAGIIVELQPSDPCMEIDRAIIQRCHICQPVSQRTNPPQICGKDKLVQIFPPKWEKCQGVLYKYWDCDWGGCPNSIGFTIVCFESHGIFG